MKAHLNVTSLAVPGWPPGSTFSSLNLPNIIFDIRIEILTLTNLYLDIHEGLTKCYLPSCIHLAGLRDQPPAASRYQNLFWIKNWNPDTKKTIFGHTWRHNIVWSPYMYLVGLLDQLLEASRSLQVKSSWLLVSPNKVICYDWRVFDTKNVIWMETYTFLAFLPPILELDVLEQSPSCPNWKKKNL